MVPAAKQMLKEPDISAVISFSRIAAANSMIVESGKKAMILRIRQFLQRHTGADHPMNQQQIMNKLREACGLDVIRATVRRNLSDLIDADCCINNTEVVRAQRSRVSGQTEENVICSVCTMNMISRSRSLIYRSMVCSFPGSCRANSGVSGSTSRACSPLCNSTGG